MFHFKQKGFAMLLVLIFMQVFALLGLFFLSENVLLQKMVTDYWTMLSKQGAKENTSLVV